MGQSTVDLPDPLQQQPAGANSADDLLSQLAGDEIDRLLTEADEDGAAAEAEAEIEPSPIAAPMELPPAASVATAIEPLAASQVPKSTESPAAVAAEPPADLGSVLNNSMSGVPAIEPAPAEPKADLDHALAEQADKDLAPQIAELKAEAAVAKAEAAPATDTEADERQGLLATVAAEATDEDLAEGPLPIWLRPLEWLSAPMDAVSDEVRSFFGKAAILTLVNSVAVIAYVFYFRRH